jgi:hypothetical protein
VARSDRSGNTTGLQVPTSAADGPVLLEALEIRPVMGDPGDADYDKMVPVGLRKMRRWGNGRSRSAAALSFAIACPSDGRTSGGRRDSGGSWGVNGRGRAEGHTRARRGQCAMVKER